MKTDTLLEIAEFLKGQQQLTLLCHVRPDGDTLGSAFGLKDCLDDIRRVFDIQQKVPCKDKLQGLPPLP